MTDNVVKGRWAGNAAVGDLGDELVSLMQRHGVQGFACVIVDKDRDSMTVFDTRSASDLWAVEGRLAAMAYRVAHEMTRDEEYDDE